MSKKISTFFALQKSTLTLLAMVILVGMGEKIAERYIPLYLLVLGGGIASVGIFSGAWNALNALYSYFGGYISNRIGRSRALLLFNAMTIVGYLIVIVFPFWQAVILGSFFFLTWSAISMPATLDLIAQSVPSVKRAMGVTMNSLARRVPMILGPLLGGILIEYHGEADGVRLAFIIAVGFALVSMLIQRMTLSSSVERTHTGGAGPRTLWREMPAALRNLLLSDMLIRFCEQIPYAFVVVWCVNIVKIPAFQFGLLTTVEMVTSVLIYLPVAYFSDNLSRKPFIVVTFIFFTVFPVFLVFAQSLPALVVAFVVRGMKEFGEPTRKARILDLCPGDRKAGMFGFYYLLRDSVVAVAAVAGAWLWKLGPSVNLFSAFCFGVAGTLWFAWKGK